MPLYDTVLPPGYNPRPPNVFYIRFTDPQDCLRLLRDTQDTMSRTLVPSLAGHPGSPEESYWMASIKASLEPRGVVYYEVHSWGCTSGERWGLWGNHEPPESATVVTYELIERTLWHPNRY